MEIQSSPVAREFTLFDSLPNELQALVWMKALEDFPAAPTYRFVNPKSSSLRSIADHSSVASTERKRVLIHPVTLPRCKVHVTLLGDDDENGLQCRVELHPSVAQYTRPHRALMSACKESQRITKRYGPRDVLHVPCGGGPDGRAPYVVCLPFDFEHGVVRVDDLVETMPDHAAWYVAIHVEDLLDSYEAQALDAYWDTGSPRILLDLDSDFSRFLYDVRNLTLDVSPRATFSALWNMHALPATMTPTSRLVHVNTTFKSFAVLFPAIKTLTVVAQVYAESDPWQHRSVSAPNLTWNRSDWPADISPRFSQTASVGAEPGDLFIGRIMRVGAAWSVATGDLFAAIGNMVALDGYLEVP